MTDQIELDRCKRIKEAGEQFASLVSRINTERGNVSWTREIILAQQKISEAVMWACKND